MKITRNIYLTRREYVEPIHYVQNTNEIQLEFFLQDFTIENTATLEYCVIQSTGTMYDAPITQFSSETITINPTKSTFGEAGQAKLYVRIYQTEESEAVTFVVPVIVAENPFSEDYDPSGDYSETITRAQLAARIEALESEKVDINQGEENAGKALVVGDDGKVTTGTASGSGLTDAIKGALLQIAEKVAYIDEYGQTYYNALYDALYPPANLISISATFKQEDNIYTTTQLDDLRNNLTVMGLYDDGATKEIETYVLSGELIEGISTVIVTYKEKTTSFNVTVSGEPKTITISTVDKENPAFTFITNTGGNVSNIYSDEGETVITSYTGGRSALYQKEPVSKDVTMDVTLYSSTKGFIKTYVGSYDAITKNIYNTQIATENQKADNYESYKIKVLSGQQLIIFDLYNNDPYTEESPRYIVTATWKE